MDLDLQREIAEVAATHPKEDLVVLLGCATKESAWTYAETLVRGDPTYAGPLAGVSLGLRVFHILEPEVKRQVPAEVFDEEVDFMEGVLDTNDILAAVDRVRRGDDGGGGSSA